jgi:phage gp29-like protein
MELGEKQKEAILKIIDGIGDLAEASMDESVDVELEKLVDDSKTPFDNIAKDAIYPALSKGLKEKLREELEKIKAKL